MRKQVKQIKYAKELYDVLREVLMHIHGPLDQLKPVMDRGYELIDRIDNELKEELKLP